MLRAASSLTSASPRYIVYPSGEHVLFPVSVVSLHTGPEAPIKLLLPVNFQAGHEGPYACIDNGRVRYTMHSLVPLTRHRT